MKERKGAQNPASATPPGLPGLAWAFFLIGLTAYSMAMLQQLKALVVGRKWLSQKEMDEGLAMVQLYPGPIMFNLATYTAYRIKGFPGAVVATSLFVLPSYVLMVLLSWLYFRYGNVAWVHPLFVALEAMVVGIVVHVALDFSGRYVDGGKTALLAGLAFVLMLFRVDAFRIVLFSVALGVLFFRHEKPEATAGGEGEESAIPGKWQWRLAGIVLGGLLFVALLAAGLMWHSGSGALLMSMFKVGAVAFGNGMTIMPLLQQEAVISHHWLTMKEFADGIAFGQVTPGPFLITATFIGYKVGGLAGSALATIGMFYPSFFYTIVMSELYAKIRNNALIRKGLKGILAGFTGMLFFVVLSLAKVSLVSPAAYVWAVGALLAVRYWKLNIFWIFLAGIAAELLLYFAGWRL
ncbi:chromate efflux transporter [Hydrogenimonas sp. SS33]|uniref:chromate efflux transporter n=1 Tax=Hydrogenimonas leucolamina TaxID=2954236 RepID=UPI00336C1612